jgi:hypothetical protein
LTGGPLCDDTRVEPGLAAGGVRSRGAWA